jgi:carboxylesterase
MLETMNASDSASNSDPDDPHPQLARIDTGEFFFAGSGLSVLLIHGLTGTPFEMRFLGERIADAGMRVAGIRLAGHAASPEDLRVTDHDHWYESVVSGFEQMRTFGDPIAVVGLSAGAVLAARLTEDQGAAVAGLAMLAPAFFLPLWTRAVLKTAAACGTLADRVYLESGSSDIHDTAVRETHPRTRLMPLRAPISLLELSALVRGRLNRICQPTLIIHSRRDHVCPWRANLSYLRSRLGRAQLRSVVLNESFHVITVDSEKERVADEVIDFLAPLRAAPAAQVLSG